MAVRKYKKKNPRQKAIYNADKEMSLFIRARDKRCVICGTTENLTNSHLFSRIHLNTRYDELNCHCNCSSCNFRHEYDPHIFTNWFIKKFGYEEYDRLYQKHLIVFKPMTSWIEEKAEYFKSLNKSND